MCEYCGCQAISAINELTREHDLVVSLISEVRTAHAGHDVGRMAELARRISLVLGPHTEVEERGLFPAMAAEFPGQIAVLEEEHRRIEAVLGEAAAGEAAASPTVDPTWPGRLVDTLEMLRDHILKEQDGVFPASLASLSSADWDVIDTIRSRVGAFGDLIELPTSG